MKLALFAANMGPCASPTVAADVARAAEAAGFESLWAGEHVVLPDPQVPPSPVPPHTPMLDPTVALTFLAAHTKTIRLGTGIIILPQRNPLVLAKELASLDVLSGGRLISGIGIGYLKPEFDALGIPFAEKGRRTEEYLRAMLAIWTMETPTFEGRFVSFRGVRRSRNRCRSHIRRSSSAATPARPTRVRRGSPAAGTASPSISSGRRRASTASGPAVRRRVGASRISR